jgi:hypothetical protein
MAARRVADENKKLRGLLVRNGITDESVEAYLGSSPADGVNDQYASTGQAVQILEQLLQARKICCVDENAPGNSTTAGTNSRESSASMSTIQSPWDTLQLTENQQTSPLSQLGNASHQFMTPTSTASRTSSVSIGHRSQRSLQHQRIAPVMQQMSRNLSPTSNSSHQNTQMFDFNNSYSLPNASSYNPNANRDVTPKHLQPHTGPQRSSIYIPATTTASNVNSCVFATDMITTMAGADSASVRADLGCLPDMDCEVDNHLVFNIMDRYSSGVGI